MWGIVKAGLIALGELLGIIKKGQEAAHDTEMQQSGADQQKAASLEATVKVARDQTAAVVQAPKTPDQTVDSLRNGGF